MRSRSWDSLTAGTVSGSSRKVWYLCRSGGPHLVAKIQGDTINKGAEQNAVFLTPSASHDMTV